MNTLSAQATSLVATKPPRFKPTFGPCLLANHPVNEYVLPFRPCNRTPAPELAVEPPEDEGKPRCSLVVRIGFRVKIAFLRLLGRLHVPAIIRPVEFRDEITGNFFSVTHGIQTRISINGRDYYFNRLTGSYDGAGSRLL